MRHHSRSGIRGTGMRGTITGGGGGDPEPDPDALSLALHAVPGRAVILELNDAEDPIVDSSDNGIDFETVGDVNYNSTPGPDEISYLRFGGPPGTGYLIRDDAQPTFSVVEDSTLVFGCCMPQNALDVQRFIIGKGTEVAAEVEWDISINTSFLTAIVRDAAGDAAWTSVNTGAEFVLDVWNTWAVVLYQDAHPDLWLNGVKLTGNTELGNEGAYVPQDWPVKLGAISLVDPFDDATFTGPMAKVMIALGPFADAEIEALFAAALAGGWYPEP